MPLPGRRDNCMNNTLTVGQPLQEHGFPPEVRIALVVAAWFFWEAGLLVAPDGPLNQVMWGRAANALHRLPAPSVTPMTCPGLAQAPVVVVTSFRDAVKDVLDAALTSMRGHQ